MRVTRYLYLYLPFIIKFNSYKPLFLFFFFFFTLLLTMSQQTRVNIVTGVYGRTQREIDFPSVNGKHELISEIFGKNVFGTREMSDRLPKPVFKTFSNQLRGGQTLDKVTADAIAHAAKVWALERNATHFTHWFQPLNDSTAEKHDSFLSLKTTFANGLPDVNISIPKKKKNHG